MLGHDVRSDGASVAAVSAIVLGTVLAHPDDETFGVGGTLVRYAAEGIAVHSLCLTRGEQGTTGEPGAPLVSSALLGPTRAAEVAEAGRRMGLRSVTVLEHDDGGLAAAREDLVVWDIVAWIRRVRPDVVITWGPDGGYGHPDHIACSTRAMRAIEVAAGAAEPALGAPFAVRRCYRFVLTADTLAMLPIIYPEFLAYMRTLVVRPERWTEDRLGARIDVRPHLARKVHAMEAHLTQAPDLAAWARGRQLDPDFQRDEAFIRAFPDPLGPVEHDLFAALRPSPSS